MVSTKLLTGTILLLLAFAGASFAATCSVDAYTKACATCSFDTSGKIDKSCMDAQKGAGIACVSTSYPLMAEEYARGKCPQVDACSTDLQQCLAEAGTGNDKADCAEGSSTTCYRMSDTCVQKAAGQCPPQNMTGLCPFPAGLIMLLVGGVFLAGYIRKQ